ncbi:MAG: 3'-5' exonuclease [Bdellovibrionaceae bacterium]|nr:3'-5' exonuclease [Pseudobdellovibrionaceae bacterium]
MQDFVSFDLETTGTLSHLDHIIEIGAVRFKNGEVEESYQQLVSIDIPIPEQASKINGITDEMLKNQASIQEVLPEFVDFCGSNLMVAHNAPFDFQFLLRVIEEHQIIAPRGLVLDTCQLARKTFPGLANYKLSTLCDYLKIDSSNFHRAESDALSCGQLFLHILKKNSFSTNQIKDFIQLAGRSPLKFPDNYLEGQMAFFEF